jgi:anti-anti-sigma factor
MNDQLLAEDGPIPFSGDVTVQTAGQLWPQALAALRARSHEAIIDMEQVTALDTAGLQILLMLRRLAIASGIDFGIQRPSRAVRQILEFSGLSDLITREGPVLETAK